MIINMNGGGSGSSEECKPPVLNSSDDFRFLLNIGTIQSTFKMLYGSDYDYDEEDESYYPQYQYTTHNVQLGNAIPYSLQLNGSRIYHISNFGDSDSTVWGTSTQFNDRKIGQNIPMTVKINHYTYYHNASVYNSCDWKLISCPFIVFCPMHIEFNWIPYDIGNQNNAYNSYLYFSSPVTEPPVYTIKLDVDYSGNMSNIEYSGSSIEVYSSYSTGQLGGRIISFTCEPL